MENMIVVHKLYAIQQLPENTFSSKGREPNAAKLQDNVFQRPLVQRRHAGSLSSLAPVYMRVDSRVNTKNGSI